MDERSARDHPVPAGGDQKIDADAFEDQTEEIEPKPSELAVWQNQSKRDQAKAKERVKRERFVQSNA